MEQATNDHRREIQEIEQEARHRHQTRDIKRDDWTEWPWVSVHDSGVKANVIFWGRWLLRIEILENKRRTFKTMLRSRFYREFKQVSSK